MASFCWRTTCVRAVAKTLEIRDVPDEVHEALAAQAAEEGLSVSAYALRELRKQVVGTIDADELLARLQSLPRIDLVDVTAADLVRQGREDRTFQIIDAISRR